MIQTTTYTLEIYKNLEQIILKKTVYLKKEYQKVILPEEVQERDLEIQNNITTVEEFFEAYDKLFYIIPQTGEINSHEYLVKRSGLYSDTSENEDNYIELVEEINRLRRENLEQEKKIIELLSK